jgi:hypothetical protein
MILTPHEREVIQRRAQMPVGQDGWQAQYVCDVPQLLDALAEAEQREPERCGAHAAEGWRLEAERLRERVIQVETERRDLKARIAQDDEERQHMTSVRETLERHLADQRADAAYHVGLLSWIAERLGSRCIEDIRTDLPELLRARDRAQADLRRVRDLNQAQNDALLRIGDALGVEVITTQSVEAAAKMYRDRIAELDKRVTDFRAIAEKQARNRQTAEAALRAAQAEQNAEHDARRIAEQRAVVAEDTLRRVNRGLSAEQVDVYKLMADGLGDTLKKIATALHVEPGNKIAETAEAIYAELAELRAAYRSS